MIVVTNSSPLIALSCVDLLSILPQLFDRVLVPITVYQETVVENPVRYQGDRIALATKSFLEIVSPQSKHQFERKLGKGERGVLNLALELQPNFVILDDKKARNEAIALGLVPIFTADVLRLAAERRIIQSYHAVMAALAQQKIYLPE